MPTLLADEHAHDDSAVTDHEGWVHDVENLRVVDASLMPSLPSANTHIPTFMIAEKIADAIASRRLATLSILGPREECAAGP